MEQNRKLRNTYVCMCVNMCVCVCVYGTDRKI